MPFTARTIDDRGQRGNSLGGFRVFGNRLLVSIDGTGQFASNHIGCRQCCVRKPRRRRKRNRKTADSSRGKEQFYHQLLAAVMIHPDRCTVLPLDAEPITREDGDTKNDCERNAARRLVASLARSYPRRELVIVEDALAANGPHLRMLTEQAMDFIIVARPDGNASLYEELDRRLRTGRTEEWEEEEDDIVRGYRMATDVPLNRTHPDIRVNSLEYWEVDANGKERTWQWITSLPLSRETAPEIQRAARARWKIENETFNALKNHGYHLEHNYGHGRQYLCSVLGMLTLLAFLIDQVQESFCRVFGQIREKYGTRRRLWERLRAAFTMARLNRWDEFMQWWYSPGSFVVDPPPH